MLSKRFFAWVGVGVLSVATIPVFAAPHLARLAARKAPAATVTKAATSTKLAAKAPVKTLASKGAVAKTTPATHGKLAVVPGKKTATKTATRTATKTATKTSTKTGGRLSTIHQTNTAHAMATAKPATHKPLVIAKKATPASTAKKLLH